MALPRDQFEFTFDGKPYRYLGYVSAADALLIKEHTGLGVLELFGNLQAGDPRALVGLVFMTLRQCGERITWGELVGRMDGENDLIAVLGSIHAVAPEDPRPAEVAVSESLDVADVTPNGEAPDRDSEVMSLP